MPIASQVIRHIFLSLVTIYFYLLSQKPAISFSASSKIVSLSLCFQLLGELISLILYLLYMVLQVWYLYLLLL
ncbi:hypothetical protein BDZ91DRAFT_539290 [Kalaharituber pfeilii]|nr:hypothetical protein BDZ91DRAFT_539290 [Kalaharituber pfeilii]